MEGCFVKDEDVEKFLAGGGKVHDKVVTKDNKDGRLKPIRG
jgi:hypothetical protein